MTFEQTMLIVIFSSVLLSTILFFVFCSISMSYFYAKGIKKWWHAGCELGGSIYIAFFIESFIALFLVLLLLGVLPYWLLIISLLLLGVFAQLTKVRQKSIEKRNG